MAFEELKQMQGVMWGAGNFDEVADTIADVHHTIVERLSPAPGERWLDVACGTGRVCELVATAGATAVGIDLASALVEVAKHRAEARGLRIDYRVGDAERLDVADAAFDVVSSTFGAMFAPDQQQVASELARAVRPGGRLGLANWTPEGRIGKMFRIVGSYGPVPPPSNPLDWGRPEHVEELLGDSFDLTFERVISTWQAPSGEAMWDFMAQRFGPILTLLEMLPPERQDALRAEMIAFSEEARRGDVIVDDREYLLVTGVRR